MQIIFAANLSLHAPLFNLFIQAIIASRLDRVKMLLRLLFKNEKCAAKIYAQIGNQNIKIPSRFGLMSVKLTVASTSIKK